MSGFVSTWRLTISVCTENKFLIIILLERRDSGTVRASLFNLSKQTKANVTTLFLSMFTVHNKLHCTVLLVLKHRYIEYISRI